MGSDEVKGRAKGGIARAKALTDEELVAIAKKGAIARWGIKATHKGNFKDDFGIDVECYVLDDEIKTAVINQIGMGLAIGLSPRGNAFPRFLASRGMSEVIGAQLAEKLSKPIKFQWTSVGAPHSISVHGFDVTLLIDVCKAIIQAEEEGKLNFQQKHTAKQAHIIINASAKAGIQNLVYKLAGYDATRQEVVNAFKLFIREEAREYEKEFPDQLYQQWYRLYELPTPGKNKPWKFKHLTVDQVYKPLAKSNGKILQLAQTQRATGQERYKKLHQFLSEIGVKALRQHLGELIGIAKLSKDRADYESNVEKIFGDQTMFNY